MNEAFGQSLRVAMFGSPARSGSSVREDVVVIPAFDLLSRTVFYARKHGLRKTVWRVYPQVTRCAFFNREGVYGVPEGMGARLADEVPSHIVVRNFGHRFSQDAVLWRLKAGDGFVGYTWTVGGKTPKPYYFPLTSLDVHIFDNLIFPCYRGLRFNSILMAQVLEALKAAGFQRAYIDTAEWNTSEQRSLERIGFTRLGYALKRRRDGKAIQQ